MKTIALAVLACVLATAAAPAAGAEGQYPNRPIKLVVGFPPGTVADVVARIVGQKLGQQFGQQVLVDNRPGASSNIAAEQVVRAPKDGYTVLMATIANTINASLYKNLKFSFAKDLSPVALVGSVPNILAVHPSLPAHSVQELIALAKSKPGEIFYASSGNGTSAHLSGELFNQMAGIKLAHIPYKGSSEAVTDLLAGRVMVIFSPASTVLPHIKAGTLRALATTGAQRAAVIPDLPTVAESGLPGFATVVWLGFMAPSGTPEEIVAKLADAVKRALAADDLKGQFAVQGIDPQFAGPKEFGAYIEAETVKWAKVVAVSGAKLD